MKKYTAISFVFSLMLASASVAQETEELSGFGNIHGAYDVSASENEEMAEPTVNYDAFLPFLEAAKEERQLLEDKPFTGTFSLLNRRSDKKISFSLSPSVTSYHVEGSTLKVNLHQCIADAEGRSGNDIAFIEVMDAPLPEEPDAHLMDRVGDIVLFSGWVYSSFPSANQFEHASYSLKLISCENEDNLTHLIEKNDNLEGEALDDEKF